MVRMSPSAQIHSDSAVPIRLQLSQILRREIQEGRLPPGTRIPSERELAQRYGISRASARESVIELLHAGFLFRTVGKGTFVADGVAGASPTAQAVHGISVLIDRRVFEIVQMGYNRTLAGIEQACRELGCNFMFRTIGDELELPDADEPGRGYIFLGGATRSILNKAADRKLACVVVDPIVEDVTGPIQIRIDYASGTRLAVERLHEFGHRAIGFIGIPGSEKYRAYWQALLALGLSYDPRQVEFLPLTDAQPGIVSGYDAAQRLLANGCVPTALVVTNDFVAMGVLERLQLAGLAVPEAVSVIGFDDLGLSTTPRLASVRVDFYQTGAAAAHTLLRLMRGEPIPSHGCVIPVELVLRGSVGKPKAG
jgi:GntR family transcriptional regulator of arabinose operon